MNIEGLLDIIVQMQSKMVKGKVFAIFFFEKNIFLLVFFNAVEVFE